MSFITKISVAVCAFTLSLNVAGQESARPPRSCGSPVPPAAWDEWFNNLTQIVQAQQASQKSSATYVIPVIVHVIHGGEAVGVYPNISKNQVNSQFTVLNADYSGTGYHVNNVPAAFASLVANCDITFLPAQLDPNGMGLPEPGIDRVDWHSICATCNPKSPSTSAAFQSFFDGSVKPATIWDPTRYMNLWVSDVASGVDLLGYATFPVGTGLNGLFSGNGGPTTDGVWVKANVVGNTGSLDPIYNKGRTATHEIGHYLGLRHIWGDANCGDDYCADTPPQQNYNSGCPGYPKISCSNGPNGEMFMNFMDYSDDPCLYMFTWNQVSRMQTAMQFGTYRKNLTASSATLCNLPGQPPTAAFLINSSTCVDSLVAISNQSNGMPGPTFAWSASPADGVSFSPSPTDAHPLIQFAQPGNFTISVVATNSTGSQTDEQQIQVIDCADAVGFDKNTSWTGVVKLIPNPAADVVTIEAGASPGKIEVRVVNAIGQTVSEQQIDGSQDAVTLDIRAFPQGVYSVVVAREGVRTVRKLLVSR